MSLQDAQSNSATRAEVRKRRIPFELYSFELAKQGKKSSREVTFITAEGKKK